MSIEKALQFITYGEMYLARYDSFEDKYEGQTVDQLAKKLSIEWEYENTKKPLSPEKRKKLLFGSCWYNGEENLAMWDRYKSERGIAVQVKRYILTDSFQILGGKNLIPNYNKSQSGKAPRVLRNYASEIDYLDENSQQTSYRFRVGLVKHSAFSHENEYRFVVRQYASGHIKANSYIYRIPMFENLHISLIINPYADTLFTKMVRSYVDSLTNRDNVNVIKSNFRELFR